MKKPKILLLTDYFYPHWTGISKSIFNLTKHLQNDLDFTVLTVKHSPELKNFDEYGKVKIIREPYFLKFSRSRISLKLILKMIQIVGQFDSVLINSPSAHILPLSLITKIFKKKLLFFHQGDLILPAGLVNRVVEKIFDISTLFSFYLGNKTSSFTRDYAEQSRVLKPFLNKFTPLIPPIIVSRLTTNKLKVADKLTLLKKEKLLLFGFAGRFVEEKGFDVLLKAIPLIINKLPDARFVFAGETNIEYENFFSANSTEIKKWHKYLFFLGRLNEEELAHFYKFIDYIVIPSRSDCFNLVQPEAMLFKKLSVASNIPGLRYLVKETGFGLLFKKENPLDLSEKIFSVVKYKDKLIKNHAKLLEILNNKKNAEKFRNYLTI